MNKKISKIIKDCGLYIAYENKAVTEKELEFFAEMIIRECANLADCPNSFKHRSGSKIRSYFGVEA